MQPSAEPRCIVRSARDGDETDHSAQSNRVARNTAIGQQISCVLAANRSILARRPDFASRPDETPQHASIDHTSHQGEGSQSSILGLAPRAQRISTAFDAISARVLMSQQSPCSLLVLLLIGLLTVETGTQLLHLQRLGGPWPYVKSSFVPPSLVHASDSREDNLLRSQASPSASPLCPCPCTTDNEVRTRRHSLYGH
jgi:hypothetical protein